VSTGMLRIEDHRLVGEGVTFRATPNHAGPLRPRYLVFHYTAGRSCASSVESLCTRKPRDNASAHVVVGSDGRIVQLAPFNVITWHAGVSHWDGRIGLNSWSIGVEMDNAGRMERVGEKFVAWFGKEYSASEVMLAEHKHGGGIRPWHVYPQAQLARANQLAELLVHHYALDDVLGHEDIARGRKQDPGPAFPLADIAKRALRRTGDSQATPARFLVNVDSLNIRKGPSASFDIVAPPLVEGVIVQLVQQGQRWSKVEVEGPPRIEGWVNNTFITPMVDVGQLQQTTRSRAPQTRARRRARG